MRCPTLHIQNIVALCAGPVRNSKEGTEACGRLPVGAFVRSPSVGVFHHRQAGPIKVKKLVAAPFKDRARQGGRSGIEVHRAIGGRHWRSVSGVEGDDRTQL